MSRCKDNVCEDADLICKHKPFFYPHLPKLFSILPNLCEIASKVQIDKTPCCYLLYHIFHLTCEGQLQFEEHRDGNTNASTSSVFSASMYVSKGQCPGTENWSNYIQSNKNPTADSMVSND